MCSYSSWQLQRSKMKKALSFRSKSSAFFATILCRNPVWGTDKAWVILSKDQEKVMLNKTTLTTLPNRIGQFMVLSYVLDREKRDVCPIRILYFITRIKFKPRQKASHRVMKLKHQSPLNMNRFKKKQTQQSQVCICEKIIHSNTFDQSCNVDFRATSPQRAKYKNQYFCDTELTYTAIWSSISPSHTVIVIIKIA